MVKGSSIMDGIKKYMGAIRLSFLNASTAIFLANINIIRLKIAAKDRANRMDTIKIFLMEA